MPRAAFLSLLGVVWSGQVAADWAPSIFSGERHRSIQGCAAKTTGESWSCAFIRCERGRPLKLYLDVPGVLSDGPITLAVDGRDFDLALEFSRNPFGGAHQVVYVDPDFFDAIAKGRLLRIRNTEIKQGYDVIPLTGLGPALGRLTKACGPSS
jgi:hypothetical protein